MNARTIIEAETPKKALRAAPRPEQFLASAGFKQVEPNHWVREERPTMVEVFRGNYQWEGPPDGVSRWIIHVWHLVQVNDDGVESAEWQMETSKIYPDFEQVNRAIVSGVYEAESPKKALWAAANRRLTPLLLKSRFVTHGSGFQKAIKHRVTGQLQRYTVWYDRPEREWVVKRERFAPGRRVWLDDYKAFKNETGALDYLKTLDYVIEAESPKKAMRAITDPNNLDALLKRIQREEEIEATPHEDSWQPGQRVRRIRHGAFGPRPYGGNPNDIGDTGTIIRFFRRLPEPAHAEYSVVWDRHQLGHAETDHRYAEAIPGEPVGPPTRAPGALMK